MSATAQRTPEDAAIVSRASGTLATMLKHEPRDFNRMRDRDILTREQLLRPAQMEAVQ